MKNRNGKLGLALAFVLFSGCEAKVFTSPQTDASPTPSASSAPTPTPSPSSSVSPSPSPSPTPTPSPSPSRPFEVGVNIHLDTSNKVAMIADMGAKWVRIDMNWEIMEPVQDQWNFDIFDQVIANAKASNLKIFATLAYAPGWASSNGTVSGIPLPEKWKNFVSTAVNRYRGKVDAFGIWNEPNLQQFWAGNAEQYVDIVLKPACKIIRDIDPAIPVVGPDLAHLYQPTIQVESFFKTITDKGAGSCFDVLSHHIYAKDDFTQKIFGFYFGNILYKLGLKQWMENTGLFGKPVWITEFGFSLDEGTEDLQAKYVTEQIQTMAGIPWMDKAFIFELTDPPEPAPYHHGLIKPDGTPRLAYTKVKELIARKFK